MLTSSSGPGPCNRALRRCVCRIYIILVACEEPTHCVVILNPGCLLRDYMYIGRHLSFVLLSLVQVYETRCPLRVSDIIERFPTAVCMSVTM